MQCTAPSYTAQIMETSEVSPINNPRKKWQKMGKKQEEEEEQDSKQKPTNSLKSKALHFVSDLTTVILNPISDKPCKPPPTTSSQDDLMDSLKHQSDSDIETKDTVDGPDTSSFTAFLYSLLASPESERNTNSNEKIGTIEDELMPSSQLVTMIDNAKKKSLYLRGKQTLGKAFHQATKVVSFRTQGPKSGSNFSVCNESNSNAVGKEGIAMQTLNEYEPLPLKSLPDTSEPSLLLSEMTRAILYCALPVIVQGRKWLLLYSTWRHGISLSTLYRRSMLWPGPTLLVVGDREGAVFGGLVEAPLKPTNQRRYQGTNTSFVFSNISGHPVIFRPAGINRYFTLCSTDYLAMGGGDHFALYLDSDLLSGSSSFSETYKNPCLARSQDFEVKDVELWGFVYASKYDEMIALSRTEKPGICRW